MNRTSPQPPRDGGTGASSTNDERNEAQLHRALKAIHFKAVTAYTRLKRDVSSLDFIKPNASSSSVVGGHGHDVGELGQEFKRTLEEYSVSVSNESVATQKIVRDFQSLLHKCEMLMKEYREKQQQQRLRVRNNDIGVGVRASGEQQQQQQEQELLEIPPSTTAITIQEELDPVVAYNEAIIRERDVAMTNISTQIGEVHQIFQDLAVLVHDQGDMVDDIESHVTRAAYKTQEAHTQLRRAEHHQRRAAKNWCFLAMLGIGACAVLLLVILS